jgi:hypothetical protein
VVNAWIGVVWRLAWENMEIGSMRTLLVGDVLGSVAYRTGHDLTVDALSSVTGEPHGCRRRQ